MSEDEYWRNGVATALPGLANARSLRKRSRCRACLDWLRHPYTAGAAFIVKLEQKMAIISVQKIKKSFSDGVQVLTGISFEVEQGEVLGIIGPSGSGKSTMLRCIAQLETIDDGTISVCGEPIVKNGVYADKKTLRKIGLNLGFVFQNFNLFPHLSVLQNITDAQIHVLKIPRSEAEETARKLLAQVGLSEKENAYPCELSGGQQQRVSIARSLALKPKVLLFDEPTSALDPELTGEILAVIRQLASEKMTMIVVTHEMAFARDISDKIIFMADGVIVEEGEPKSLISNPQTERLQEFLKRFNQ